MQAISNSFPNLSFNMILNKSQENKIVGSILNESNEQIEKFVKNWSNIEAYFGKPTDEIPMNKWYYQFIADLKKCVFKNVNDLKVNGTSTTRNGYKVDTFYIDGEGYTVLLDKNPEMSEFLRPEFVNKFGSTCQDVIDFINKTEYNKMFEIKK